tara:strand:+ start:229 stop:441 length:213 start_codon:yes stop_codon:yes gene_type:complete
MTKPLRGPVKYGNSKDEKKRAINDAIKIFETLGTFSAAVLLTPILGPLITLFVPRCKNLSKTLKKMKKQL